MIDHNQSRFQGTINAPIVIDMEGEGEEPGSPTYEPSYSPTSPSYSAEVPEPPPTSPTFVMPAPVHAVLSEEEVRGLFIDIGEPMSSSNVRRSVGARFHPYQQQHNRR